MAKKLSKKYNRSEIARLLNITQPAVSQYLSKSRGKKVNKIFSNKEIQKIADGVLSEIEKNEKVNYVCLFCEKIKKLDLEKVKI
ncbi:MAG: hypothetical protein QXJ62_01010 [Nitrososphaeria archaeon]